MKSISRIHSLPEKVARPSRGLRAAGGGLNLFARPWPLLLSPSWQRKQQGQDAARDRPRRLSRLGQAAFAAWHFRQESKVVSHHHPKPAVPVPVVRIVPVAVGAAHVPLIVVERAPTQHAVAFRSAPAQGAPAGRSLSAYG